MKKFIQWLAKVFKANIEKEVIKYVTKEVEVIKEKQISLEGVIEGDVTVKGDLYVTGHVYVAGHISAQGEVYYGMTEGEVRMKADDEVTAQSKIQ